jgi:hypothetical protein
MLVKLTSLKLMGPGMPLGSTENKGENNDKGPLQLEKGRHIHYH